MRHPSYTYSRTQLTDCATQLCAVTDSLTRCAALQRAHSPLMILSHLYLTDAKARKRRELSIEVSHGHACAERHDENAQPSQSTAPTMLQPVATAHANASSSMLFSATSGVPAATASSNSSTCRYAPLVSAGPLHSRKRSPSRIDSAERTPYAFIIHARIAYVVQCVIK